jgi:hypothetical protein
MTRVSAAAIPLAACCASSHIASPFGAPQLRRLGREVHHVGRVVQEGFLVLRVRADGRACNFTPALFTSTP